MTKEEFAEVAYDSAGPMVRFIGHALAVTLGLVALTAILIIPILLVRLLIWLGFAELGEMMHMVELGLLYADLGFFALTLVIGAMELLLTEIARSWKRIKLAFS